MCIRIVHFGELCFPETENRTNWPARPRCILWCFWAFVTHMSIKLARRVDVGSACSDIQPSPKTDVLVYISCGGGGTDTRMNETPLKSLPCAMWVTVDDFWHVYLFSSFTFTLSKGRARTSRSYIRQNSRSQDEKDFTTQRCAIALYMLSSCVRLSVTSRHCSETAKRRIMQTTPYDSPGTLVFLCQKSRWNSNGITPNGGANRDGVG